MYRIPDIIISEKENSVMLIHLNQSHVNDRLLHHLNNAIRISPRQQRVINKLFELANNKKSKIPLLVVYKKIQAFIVKIIREVHPFNYNDHFIIKNILSQTTYYKTITSRP